MTETEFVQATSRIEQYFDKDYTTEQRKIMFDQLKEMRIEKYIKAVNYCIRNCKYMPKIVDLTSADISTVNFQRNKDIEFVKCNKCNGEGFVKYFRKLKNGETTIEYEYVAFCTCENARKQQEVNKYRLPTITEIGL